MRGLRPPDSASAIILRYSMLSKRERYRIFISYSRKDSTLVNPLVRLLLVADDRVFQDVRDIDPGSRWRAVITMAVESCDKMLLFWCTHSSNSVEVEKEYDGALQHGKAVVPVLLDDTRLPKRLKEYQSIDLRQAFGPHKEGRVAVSQRSRGNGGDEPSGETELAVMVPSAKELESGAAQLRAGLGALLDRRPA